jgi:preprotein translocase subunit SecE
MSWQAIILGAMAALVLSLLLFNSKRLLRGWSWGRNFYHEVMMEMKKVSWPAREDVINNTILVTVTVIVLMVFLGIGDWFLGKIVGWMFNIEG